MLEALGQQMHGGSRATRSSTGVTGSSTGSGRAAWRTSIAPRTSQLRRQVALKLLHRRFAEDPEFVERFRREATSAAGLQHPNVVGIFDRGDWDGTLYIAMEYLRGRTLKEIVHDQARWSRGRAVDI